MSTTNTNKPQKGQLLGECYRTACKNKVAIYYNHSTKEHYCASCAHLINDYNPEAKQIYGHELCTLVKVSDEDRLEAICAD